MPKKMYEDLEKWESDGFTIIPNDEIEKGIRGFSVFKKTGEKEESYNPYWYMFGGSLKSDIIIAENIDDVISFWSDNKENTFACNDLIRQMIGMACPDIENGSMVILQWKIAEHKEWKKDFPSGLNDIFESKKINSWKDYDVEKE